MEIPALKDLSYKARTDSYISKHYPEFYQLLIERYGDVNIKEKLYLYYNNMYEPQRCVICGKYTKLESYNTGYRKYCSSKCCNSDISKIEKTKMNNQNKYGVDNISQLDSIKKKKKESLISKFGNLDEAYEHISTKVKQTKLNKYGDENYINSDKFKQTCLERYGVEHISQLNSVKEKKKQTCLERYGVEHVMLDKIFKEKVFNSTIKNTILKHDDIIDIIKENGEIFYICKCTDSKCQSCQNKCFKIHKGLYHSRHYHGIEICSKKNPIDEKSKNTSIELYVRNILDEYNIPYICNTRICSNLEVDIFIPTKNIAIECNGIYWHSSDIKDKKYHYNKYKTYIDNGIQLISVWEDWIKTKPKIIKSIILSKLGIYKYKIYARKCIIKNVDSETCKTFLEKNHIQGDSKSPVRLGLYYNDKLVSLMTFSKKRRSMIGNSIQEENTWELTRFCSEMNTVVIGGADKLLKYFIKLKNPAKIVSFASHDISVGKLYEKLGFNRETSCCGSYWYVHKSTMLRYHRYTFRKSKLLKLGYDKNESENQIMSKLPYYKIYDSGQTKYVLKLIKIEEGSDNPL